MTVMDPNTQTVDPEEGGVEVDLNGSNDTMETEMPSSGVPVHDDWSESQGEDAHHTHHGKYHEYDCVVDPDQEDRASQIKLCSFKRPHMRAFHLAWWCYHVAFLMWFSITPLLSEVQISLNLTKEEIWTSSIAAVSGTIIMRFALGPFCDKYGPRIPMGVILLCSAIPTGLTGLANTATGLTIIRFFIGIGGSTFVMCQFWTSTMFTREWVGTANATVAGWGNLGGGTTQILMGSILFPLFRNIYNDPEKAWRTICVFPAIIGVITAFCAVKLTDDSPKGNFSKLKKQDQMGHVNVWEAYKKGIFNINTWLVFVQYACCFGVEITMNNAAALYFKEQFGLTTESAAAIASIFGWMNLFARGMGGYISDKFNRRWGMRGRLGWQSIVLLMEGLMVISFANSKKLGAAIAVLVIFSVFVQAAEGSSFGIVPYINPKFTGSLSGIIGSGGNVGAVAFGLCFRQMTAWAAFMAMGCIILFSSVLSIFVFIPGQSGLVWKTADPMMLTKTLEGVTAIEGGDEGNAANSVASKDSDTQVELSDHASNSDGSL